MVDSPAQAAGHRDPGVGDRALGGAFLYAPTAVARRLAAVASLGGQGVPSGAICVDAGVAAARLGDDFGGGRPGDAQPFGATAGAGVGQRAVVRGAAQGPWLSCLRAVSHGAVAPGGGAVPWVDSPLWRAAQDDGHP